LLALNKVVNAQIHSPNSPEIDHSGVSVAEPKKPMKVLARGRVECKRLWM
jgi:hypothetical protein